MRIAYLKYYLRVKVKTPYAHRKMTLQLGDGTTLRLIEQPLEKGCSQFTKDHQKLSVVELIRVNFFLDRRKPRESLPHAETGQNNLKKASN